MDMSVIAKKRLLEIDLILSVVYTSRNLYVLLK